MCTLSIVPADGFANGDYIERSRRAELIRMRAAAALALFRDRGIEAQFDGMKERLFFVAIDDIGLLFDQYFNFI